MAKKSAKTATPVAPEAAPLTGFQKMLNTPLSVHFWYAICGIVLAAYLYEMVSHLI